MQCVLRRVGGVDGDDDGHTAVMLTEGERRKGRDGQAKVGLAGLYCDCKSETLRILEDRIKSRTIGIVHVVSRLVVVLSSSCRPLF